MPISERVPDLACIGFAVWTLCAHAVVAAAGGLDRLIGVAALAFAITALAFARLRGPSSQPSAALADAAADPRAPSPRARAAAAAAGTIALAGWWATGDVLLLWWCAVALLFVAAFATLRSTPAPLPPSGKSRGAEIFLWSLALACVAATLLVHRFDIDDAFYLNVAVAAVDDPARALFASDTLLGIPELAVHNPAHRALTLELLNAAVSRVTGIPAILCLHVLTAGFVALLVPLAHARLFRRLIAQPIGWAGAVFATVVVLWVAGDTHRSFGNYAFVRAWQGKAIFLTVALPLIYAHAIRFSATSAWRDWIRLAAVQVAAVGVTSTAIWAAPLAGGLALASQLRADTRGFAVFARGIAACAYPLAVGLVLRGDITGAIPVEAPSFAAGTWLADSLSKILGTGAFGLAALGATLWLAAFARGDALRRFAIVVPLGALLTVANPYLEDLTRSIVTGPSHWRSLWAIPFPILLGLLISAPLTAGRSTSPLVARGFYAAALALLLLLPRTTPVSEPGPSTSFRLRPWSERGRFPHHLRFAAPGPKVDPVAYAQALRLARAAPAGACVVAPEAISLWLGAIHDAPVPVSDRALYMTVRKRQLGADEVKRRKRLTNYTAAPSLDPARIAEVRDGLRRYEVEALLVRPVPGDDPLRAMLRAEGYELERVGDLLDLWVRSAAVERAKPEP